MQSKPLGLLMTIVGLWCLYDYLSTGCIDIRYGRVCGVEALWAAICMGALALFGIYLLGKKEKTVEKKEGKDSIDRS